MKKQRIFPPEFKCRIIEQLLRDDKR